MHIKNFDPYDFSKKEIEGIPIYYKNLPWAPCIHIYFQFNVGAFQDPVGCEGVAHFLEHLIGNGCPSIPDKKAMKEFSRLYMLNSRNAYTGYNQTVYLGKCLPENFPKVFNAMKHYVFNPFLRPEDVEHERKVITQEAWGRYKNDRYLKYSKEVSQNIYHGHQRARIASPLGWPETVATISKKHIADFHKTNYVKENLSIFVVGGIQEDDIVIIKNVVKDIPSGEKSEVKVGEVGKPKIQRFERIGDEIGDPREQVDLSIVRATHSVSEEENDIGDQARMLLYDILFERLRIEHSLCYGVSVWYRRYKDYLEAGINVETSEDKFATAEKEIWNVLKEIEDGKWSDRFDTLHRLSIDQIKAKERSSDSVLEYAANNLLVNGKILPLDETLPTVEKITYEDVKNLIKKMFNPEYTFTEVILPSKK